MRRIDLERLVDLPANGIIKLGHFERIFDASRIVARARERAEEIIDSAAAEADQIRRAARCAGLQQGLSAFEGVNARLDEARQSLHLHVDRLIRGSLGRLLGEVPKDELFRIAIQSVVEAIPSAQGGMTILVHPDNVRLVETAVQAFRQASANPVRILCEAGGRLAHDECLIYAGSEVIDTSLPVIVDELADALRAAPRWEPPHEV